MNLNRRNFLKGTAAGAAGTALVGGVLIEGARQDANATVLGNPVLGNTGLAGTGQASSGPVSASTVEVASYPFHGANQAGILTPLPSAKQMYTCVASFDSMAANKAELADLFQTVTTRSRFLAAGGTPPNLGVGQPPSDSDVLGPVVPADGLTATFSVGSTLFDDRYGIGTSKPVKLKPMTAFPNDSLEDAWLGGDLLVQFCANHPDTIHHAIRDLTKHTRGGMQLNWKMEGYNSPPRPSGTSRNLLGFKDGTANPTGSLAPALVWVDAADHSTGDSTGEPAWAHGGSYLVVRLIRMLVEFWDRVSVNEQEGIFGRRRDTGAPLDGTREFDTPNYKADPNGHVIPLDSHIRLANPRTPQTADQRLIRRSYNYDLGVDLNGNLQAGHIFIAYQQDVDRQFETVQRRLVNEPLVDYVQPFGGGYFFTLPGVRDASDWYGRSMLA